MASVVNRSGWQWLLVCLLCCLLWTPLYSQGEPATGLALDPAAPLRVGITQDPPFAMRTDDDWDGLAVYLWQQVVEPLEVTYDFVEGSPTELAAALAQGELDLIITAQATGADLLAFDFTQSYYTTYLALAERPDRILWRLLQAFISPTFLQLAAGLIVLLGIVGLLIWLFERKHDEPHFGEGLRQGLGHGFWWAAVTMSTIGYGDLVPKTRGGRILALFWILMTMGITAGLTATLTSLLTLNTELNARRFPEDLQGMTVGVVANASAADYLSSERITFTPFDDAEAGLTALVDGEIALFLATSANLYHLNNDQFRNTLHLQETTLRPAYHAFALAPGRADLYKTLNRRLLLEISEADWQRAVDRYIPK
jgi:polar amino acid transport system substrate-binding protein